MSTGTLEQVDTHFRQVVSTLAPPSHRLATTGGSLRSRGPLTAARALAIFDSQLGSRHLDLAARWLRARGDGFYTIGSSGHEGNAAVAAALRPTDPALLHYRSGGFYLERARQVPGSDGVRDVLLGLVAAVDDPISGGRHKVFGRRDLAVIPQTSTIASHLPRALGVAFSLSRAQKLGVETAWPADSVVVCSFGDASANHSTATGAINSAIQAAYRGLPVPLLLVCEDNGLGISVPTPRGWIADAYGNRAGLRYFTADGSDLADALRTAQEATDWVRRTRRPGFLHLRTVRLMGHAGTDVESSYRAPSQIAADLDRDPLLGTARLLISAGLLTPAEVLERYEAKRAEVREVADEVAALPRLASREAVTWAVASDRPDAVKELSGRSAPEPLRRKAFGGAPPGRRQPAHPRPIDQPSTR